MFSDFSSDVLKKNCLEIPKRAGVIYTYTVDKYLPVHVLTIRYGTVSSQSPTKTDNRQPTTETDNQLDHNAQVMYNSLLNSSKSSAKATFTNNLIATIIVPEKQ